MDALKKPNCANSSPLTPLGFIERAATVYGNSPSIVYNNLTYTWTQTYRRCLQLASSISRLSIGKGDVVSVLAPNIPAIYELHYAITMTGAIINTINTRLDARTISVIIQHSECKLLFIDYQLTRVIQEAISLLPDHCPHPILVLIADDGPVSLPIGKFINTYEAMVEAGDPGFIWVRPESDWDPLVLNYTSGTTSAPKGVVHCHRGTFIVAMDSLLEWGVPKQPVYLWTLPMFHANGWSHVWGMAALGATNVCLRKFDASTIYKAIHTHHVTHMCGAPVVLNMLSNGEPLSHTVHLLTAGAPPPAAVLLRAESLGFDVTHGYGLTETTGLALSCSWKSDWKRLPATEKARLKARQGVRTIGMTAVDIVDAESGVSVPHDGLTQGEIVLRGACLMLGYLKDPEATAKCIKNGWFYTGDVGVMHADGYIEIKDRSKDVIISGGENISSVEVESALYLHPAVNEAAVVGRPDEFWGETPCAFVTLKDDCGQPRPTAEEIMRFCKGKLPGFMLPKSVVFKEELPKTSTGKIQKYALREYVKNMGFPVKSRI
ncbi:putative AMP-dependent synthetase/ligase, AMP-binding, AMP-binding enzyme domain, ANL [Helianthus annuus]|nr:putative AMP-dependent synthetase/ligase, AMP-binding, AMP-binding enzyme domain, ANL [Helianthus annuus]KAJ0840495.1 putative AMP-dependent synthetase/ligase, AMP-binding enzyme domain-containing protein [Helianthus annuus]